MADLKLKELEDQLKRINCNFRFWGRSEIKELAHVLFPGEVVEHCVNGSYEGGFALLAATNQRVLLVDKKPMYLTLEDVRFDMIAEVDYNHRLLNARIFICTPNKSLDFVGYNHARLRALFHFVQTRVMEIRQHYSVQSQQMQQQLPPQQSFTPSPVMAQQVASPITTVQQSNQPLGSMSEPDDMQQPQSQSQTLQAAQSVFHRQAPVISAYTRLPLMSRQRRFLGSRAMNTPMPSIYRR